MSKTDTELEDREKEGCPQSRQRQEEGTGAQEEAENTLLRAVCRRDREEEAIQQGVGHKGACEAPDWLGRLERHPSPSSGTHVMLTPRARCG